MIRDCWSSFKKTREEEDEARGLIEEMQRNFHEAQNKSYEVERKMDRVLREYIEAFDKERERPQLKRTSFGRRCRADTRRTETWTKVFMLKCALPPSWRGDLGVDPGGRPPGSTAPTMMVAVPPAQGGIQILDIVGIVTNWNDMEKSRITRSTTNSGFAHGSSSEPQGDADQV